MKAARRKHKIAHDWFQYKIDKIIVGRKEAKLTLKGIFIQIIFLT